MHFIVTNLSVDRCHFKEFFLVMFDQNVITGPAVENDRLLQSFSQLKPHPRKLAFIFLRF